MSHCKIIDSPAPRTEERAADYFYGFQRQVQAWSPIPVLYRSAASEPISWAGWRVSHALQDNRLNSTERDRLTHSQISPNNSPPGCWGQIWASSRYKGHRREQELFLRFSKTSTRLIVLCGDFGENKREDWEEEEV